MIGAANMLTDTRRPFALATAGASVVLLHDFISKGVEYNWGMLVQWN
jgi:hypothetical protein